MRKQYLHAYTFIVAMLLGATHAQAQIKQGDYITVTETTGIMNGEKQIDTAFKTSIYRVEKVASGWMQVEVLGKRGYIRGSKLRKMDDLNEAIKARTALLRNASGKVVELEKQEITSDVREEYIENCEITFGILANSIEHYEREFPGQEETIHRLIGSHGDYFVKLYKQYKHLNRWKDALRVTRAWEKTLLKKPTSEDDRKTAQSLIARAKGNAIETSAPKSLFDGKSLAGWAGATSGYKVENGVLVTLPSATGILHTDAEYDDFVLEFEFRLTAAANNGIGIRCDKTGDPSFTGFEVQVLDDTAPKFANAPGWGYHGSIYGVAAAKKGSLKPIGEWNKEVIKCVGSNITVTLNGNTILTGDLNEYVGQLEGRQKGRAAGLQKTKGHIALCGNRSRVDFRNIRIKTEPE